MNPQQEARLLDVVLIALAFCSAVALVIFAIGCAPLPERDTSPPLSQRARVYWIEPPPTPEERARILSSVDRAERVYRARFNTPPVQVVALVFDPRPLLHHVHGFPHPLLGLCARYPHGSTIWLPVGGMSPARATLHELHHASGLGDDDHKDPSWREVRWLEQALGAGGEE